MKVVTKGFFQTFNIDYNDIFSPIIKYDSIWSVLAIIARKDLDIIQFEIKITFLYVDLNEEIYICQPESLIVGGSEDKVCLFHKSVYGFKQASKEWNKWFNDFLVSYNLKPTSVNPCVYVSKIQPCFICTIFIDDRLIYNDKNINQKDDTINKMKLKL
jgi:hypothetical protein